MKVEFSIIYKGIKLFFFVECEDEGERVLCINFERVNGGIYFDTEEGFTSKFVKSLDEYWRAVDLCMGGGYKEEEEELLEYEW